MSVCRICLSSNPNKDITEIETNNDSQNGENIIFFCLGIQIFPEYELSSKLCLQCYIKIMDFHQFKSQSLRNDAMLRSLGIKEFLKNSLVKEELSQYSEEECSEEPVIQILQTFDSKIVYDVVNPEENIQMDQDDWHYEPPIEIIEQASEEVPVKKKVTRQNSKCFTNTVMKGTSNNAKADAETIREICKLCGVMVTDYEHHLLQHQTLDTPALQCEHCFKLFKSKQTIRKHIMNFHLNKCKPHMSGIHRVKCPLCHKNVTKKSFAFHNKKVHMIDTRAKCHICNKEVSHGYLKMHIDMNHQSSDHRFKCDYCGRTFLLKGLLRRHITSHSGVKPFACEICGAAFRLKYSVDLHKREVHEKRKDHVCHICSKPFFSNSKLQKHIKSHELGKGKKDGKGKEVICPDCGKPMASKYTLRHHRQLHKGSKLHMCQLCNKTFATRKYAVNHLKTHTQVRKFSCKFCSKSFVRTTCRRKHELEVHMHQKTKTKKYPRPYKYRPKGKKAKEERERQIQLAEQASQHAVKIEHDKDVYKYIKTITKESQKSEEI